MTKKYWFRLDSRNKIMGNTLWYPISVVGVVLFPVMALNWIAGIYMLAELSDAWGLAPGIVMVSSSIIIGLYTFLFKTERL